MGRLGLHIASSVFLVAVMTVLDVVMVIAHLFLFTLAVLTFVVSRNEVSVDFMFAFNYCNIFLVGLISSTCGPRFQLIL